MDVDSLVEEEKPSKECIEEGEKLRVISLEDQIKALEKELFDLKNASQGPRQSESESTPSVSNALDSISDSTTDNLGTLTIDLEASSTKRVNLDASSTTHVNLDGAKTTTMEVNLDDESSTAVNCDKVLGMDKAKETHSISTALTDSVPAATTTISTTSAANDLSTVNKDSTTTTTTSGCFNAVSSVTSTTPIDYSKKDEQKGVAEKVNKTAESNVPRRPRLIILPATDAAARSTYSRSATAMASRINKPTTVPVNNGSIATAKLHKGKGQPPILDFNAAATNATLAKIGLQEIEKVLHCTSAATSVGVTTAPSHAPSGNNKGDTTVGDCTSTTTKHCTSTSPVATATTTVHTNRSLSTSAKTLHSSSSTSILSDEEQGGERNDFSPPSFADSPISFSVNSPIFRTSDSSRNERQQGEQKGVAEKVTKTTESNVRKAVPGRPRMVILPATAAAVGPTNSRFTTMTSLINKTTTVLVNNGSIATRNEMQQDEQNGTDATTSDDIVDQKPSLPSLHVLSYSSTSKGIDKTVTATISPPSTEDLSTDTLSVADIPDLYSKRLAVLKELEQLDTAIQSLKEDNNSPANTKPKAGSARPSRGKRKVSTRGKAFTVASVTVQAAETPTHTCSTCGKTFTWKSSLISHMKMHTGEKPHDCLTCGKTFLYKSRLVKHIEGHKGETQCKCFICGKPYLLSEDLKVHMRSHTRQRPYECTECEQTFTVKSALNSHMRTHTGIKPHKCTICGKMYAKLYNLNVHVRRHTGERPYQCAFCGKGFAAKAKHTQHVKLHGEKLQVCSICGKAFPRTDYLRIHMRTHTGEKPYGCTTCGKAFTVKSALNSHIRVHTGETPHACSICGKAFAQSGTLQQHLRVHTGVKPYLCSICGKAFACGSAYRVHKRIHTGLKPYKCLICGKAFASTASLYMHKIVHSGERPFVCTACGKAFMFKAHLKRHSKIHARVRGNEFTSWS